MHASGSRAGPTDPVQDPRSVSRWVRPRRKTLDRTIYPAVPPHVEYALTSLGQSAAIPLNALRSWVEENIDHASRPEPVMS